MGLRDDGKPSSGDPHPVRPGDWDTGHLADRFWGHFIIGFAIIDAYIFRQRLVPELVSTPPALAQQATKLAAAAAAAIVLAALAYVFTRQTSRSRTRVYIGGAALFALFTFAMLVDDYRHHAVPGTFTQRMGEAYGKIQTFIDAVRGR